MAQSDAPPIRGFLFADLRGYTQFVEQHGDAAASELLGIYRSVVRAAVARFQGAELLCDATPARARIDWIFDGEELIATAERDDGDGKALYRWWLEEGRLILR